MKITFLPQNITWEATAGETILQAAVKAGVNIDGNCAGLGTCGKCKVKIISGNKEICNNHHNKLSVNEIEAGYRLACCHPVSEGMIIEMPESETTASRKKKLIQLPGNFTSKESVIKKLVTVPKASLANQQSDEELIWRELDVEGLKIDYQVLLDIPKILKDSRDVTFTISDNVVIHVEAGDTTKENYGVAVDIGTTTVVIMLWNLATAEMVQVDAKTNPQGLMVPM
ncbi:2Fe-2S iron-sulfur cluster-binding protein [Aminipila terrae]|uniref:2Fe-2S iron-sulfur cluster binding domain-containing protein n=1 Tax=Aminipila terrae TaxID=2697030 RepID=A0A6P1MLJ8_9FIRM|nr:2Fe-2S iron-sulfur cluster-binding protein [Aminipila terrae]QHI72948.1 2Fe-2S iron-sulfur cluster binding domain-containing protein [Aminipila terrae]